MKAPKLTGTWTHFTADTPTLRRETRGPWDALEGLEPGRSLCILTKGQFHLADLIRACLEITGPAEVLIATWTVSEAQVGATKGLIDDGKATRVRWLLDMSFSRRGNCRDAALLLKATFPPEDIRSTSSHAKFTVIRGEESVITITTSMNLNQNPRFEYANVSMDENLAAFFEEVTREVWEDQQPGSWITEQPGKTLNRFTRGGQTALFGARVFEGPKTFSMKGER